MAILKKWVCDGCNAVTETELETMTCSFYQIRVTAGSWGDDYLLCPKCHERLLGNIDAKQWPKFPVATAA